MSQVVVQRNPIGRFGNHLFQYYFAYRFANEFKSDLIHPDYEGKDVFSNLRKSSLYGIRKFTLKTPLTITNESPKEFQDCRDLVLSEFHKGRAVQIARGVMDSYFIELPLIDPNEIFNISKLKSKYHLNNNPEKDRIVLHFRGSDFEQWNSRAIMRPKYYYDSIDHLKSVLNFENSQITIVTDDPSHPNCLEIVKNLSCNVSASANKYEDFIKMINSDALVSSPSSFCFWGGTLGKRKLFIQNKFWLDYVTRETHPFWSPIRKNLFPYLQTSREI